MKKRLALSSTAEDKIYPTIGYYYYPDDDINVAVDEVTNAVINDTVENMMEDVNNNFDAYYNSIEEENDDKTLQIDSRNLTDAQKLLMERHGLPLSLSSIIQWMNSVKDSIANDKKRNTTTNVTFISCNKIDTRINKLPKRFMKAKKGTGTFTSKDYPRHSNFTGILDTGAGVISGFRDIRSWGRNNFYRPNYNPNPDANPYQSQESSLVVNIQDHLLLISEPLYGPYDVTRTKIYDPSSLSSWTLIVGSQKMPPSIWTNVNDKKPDSIELTGNEKKSLELAVAERVVWMATLTGAMSAAKSIIVAKLEEENDALENKVSEGIQF